MLNIDLNRPQNHDTYLNLKKIKDTLAAKRQRSSPPRHGEAIQKTWSRLAESLITQLSNNQSDDQNELTKIECQIAELTAEIRQEKLANVKPIADLCDEILQVAEPILVSYQSTTQTLTTLVEACQQRAAAEAAKENENKESTPKFFTNPTASQTTTNTSVPRTAPRPLPQIAPGPHFLQTPPNLGIPLPKEIAQHLQEMITNCEKLLEGTRGVRSYIATNLYLTTLKTRNEYANNLADYLADEVIGNQQSIPEQQSTLQRALDLCPITGACHAENAYLRRKLGDALLVATKRKIGFVLGEIATTTEKEIRFEMASRVGDLIDYVQKHEKFFCLAPQELTEIEAYEAKLLLLFPKEEHPDAVQVKRLAMLSNHLRGFLLHALARDEEGNVLPESQQRLGDLDIQLQILRKEICALEKLTEGNRLACIEKATIDLQQLGERILLVFAPERVAGEFNNFGLVNLARAEKGLDELNAHRPRPQIWMGSNILQRSHQGMTVNIADPEIDTIDYEVDNAMAEKSAEQITMHTAVQMEIPENIFDVKEGDLPVQERVLKELTLITGRLDAIQFNDLSTDNVQQADETINEEASNAAPNIGPNQAFEELTLASDTCRQLLLRFYAGKRADKNIREITPSQVTPPDNQEIVELIHSIYRAAVDLKLAGLLPEDKFTDFEVDIDYLENLLELGN